mmetsp:Transcript_7017/g.10521  ORF Transcript_7017/g.10521 Transcript_7017/m.10521 type:complete len:134 (-) Transcript_7017:666-1067(-)
MTAMLSAFSMVLSLWAMTRVVKRPPRCRSSKAACTSFSFSLSSAEVASSSRRILGLFRIARAIASRCFCPPESSELFSPTSVSHPRGNPLTKSSARAAPAAASSSASPTGAPPAPYTTFSLMVPAKSTGSWPT